MRDIEGTGPRISTTSGDWTRKHGGTWGWRTVRNGRVKWYGAFYVPGDGPGTPLTAEELALLPQAERVRNGMVYDGRLEGVRLLFCTYGALAEEYQPSLRGKLYLWGNNDWPGPHCVDGIFRWDGWVLVEDSP